MVTLSSDAVPGRVIVEPVDIDRQGLAVGYVMTDAQEFVGLTWTIPRR